MGIHANFWLGSYATVHNRRPAAALGEERVAIGGGLTCSTSGVELGSNMFGVSPVHRTCEGSGIDPVLTHGP